MIFVTSDWHFNHNKAFIWGSRGFSSIDEMNEQIIERHNAIVCNNDTVYVLGDCGLGSGTAEALDNLKNYIERLNGNLIIIRGNHDTDSRIKMYEECKNVIGICDAKYLNYNKHHFYLSHFPTLTANLEKKSLKQCTLNLYGHTHQKTNFFEDIPYMYHCGVDSHDCYPVSITQILTEMYEKVNECKKEL